MKIGKGIKTILKAKSISQKELASMTDLSETSLSLLARGKTQPRKDTLDIIAKALRVKPEVLLLLSIDEQDVPDSKLEIYNSLWPFVEKAMLDIFNEEKS